MKIIKKNQGFTLIELMIVIAIIAILATLGVTNFASAIRRARDSKRQSDIVAVQKALETCYDIRTGQYIRASSTDPSVQDVISADSESAWDLINEYQTKPENGCLNAPIEPVNESFPYMAQLIDDDGVQGFILCARLENFNGNYSDAQVGDEDTGTGPLDGTTLESLVATPCGADETNCNIFCVQNSQ